MKFLINFFMKFWEGKESSFILQSLRFLLQNAQYVYITVFAGSYEQLHINGGLVDIWFVDWDNARPLPACFYHHVRAKPKSHERGYKSSEQHVHNN